jgi:hypothetical protein
MKVFILVRRCAPMLCVITMWILVLSQMARTQATVFTYQGYVEDSSVAANGVYDLQFTLYDENGAAIGTITRDDVQVTNGVFNVQLDFTAAAFPGTNRTLEIAIRRGAETGAFIALTPRQPVTATPYAIRALNATNADNAATAALSTNATNAQQLGHVPAGQFVQTNSGTFIRNQTIQQADASFNVGGTGKANAFDAVTNYSINGERILSIPGSVNLFIGVKAGASNTEGYANTFIGALAGQNNTIGNQNSFFGLYTGHYNTRGTFNAFYGNYAGFKNTTGNENSFFGEDAGNSNTTGSNNSFFGNASGNSNSVGYYNSFFGQSAGFSNNSGYRNAFYGAGSGQSNGNGYQNSAFGAFAGGENTTGILNLFVGAEAGLYNTTGSNNSFVGAKSGNVNTTGRNNTFIGHGAEAGSNNLDHGTAIGSGATVSASNTIALGRSNGDDKVVVYGLGAADTNTALCRNSLNQISLCVGRANLKPEAAGTQDRQITALQTQVDGQAIRLAEQKALIDELRALVCQTNAQAAVCKE